LEAHPASELIQPALVPPMDRAWTWLTINSPAGLNRGIRRIRLSEEPISLASRGVGLSNCDMRPSSALNHYRLTDWQCPNQIRWYAILLL
jgi:hypothetical protein